jgi:hypothetical protein
MLGHGNELLRRLASGARPDGARAAAPRASIQHITDSLNGFASLLDASTRIGSHRAIGVPPSLGLELAEAIRQRLGRVADRAAGAGLGRVIAVIPEGVVMLDTGRRAVVEVLHDRGDEPLTGFDGLAVLTSNADHDQLFGVGLHGPRPKQRESGAEASHQTGSRIASAIGLHAGWSSGVIDLLVGQHETNVKPHEPRGNRE